MVESPPYGVAQQDAEVEGQMDGRPSIGDVVVIDPLVEVCGQLRGLFPIWNVAGRDGLDQVFQVIGQLSLTRADVEVVIVVVVSVVSVVLDLGVESVFQGLPVVPVRNIAADVSVLLG